MATSYLEFHLIEGLKWKSKQFRSQLSELLSLQKMSLAQVITLPSCDGVQAFLPQHLSEVFYPNQPPLNFNTTSRDFELACQTSESGQLAILQGSYRTLLNDAFRDIRGTLGRLRSMAQTPRRVAVLCTANRAVDLEHAPPVIGANKISKIPPYWYDKYYLLSVAGFADLQLRFIYSTRGLTIPSLPKPLIIELGVFIPDFNLIRTFLQVAKSYRSQGIDDFSNKIICDTFSGSGVFGFLAGYLGARSVHFIDIDPLANECVSRNINEYRPEFWSGVHTADVFQEGLRVDTIIANPPWKDVRRRGELSIHFHDPDRTILKRFFINLRNHLLPNGVVYLFYERAGRQQIYEQARDFSVIEYPVKALGAPRLLFRLQSRL